MAEFSYSAPAVLNATHDVEHFDCGKPALNDFLQRHALANQSGGSARTFVVADGPRVVGYYSLTAAAIAHEDSPERIRKGQPRHPIPAILMARFAVDRMAQGQGLGRALFRDAILRSLTIVEHLGARAFMVDAKDDEAARFYSRFGMVAAPNNPHRLYLLFKDVRKLLSD